MSKSEHGGVLVSHAAQLKALEEGNAKLKRLLAVSFRVGRDQNVSLHRGARLVGVDQPSVRRERPPAYSGIRIVMKVNAAKRYRQGYRPSWNDVRANHVLSSTVPQGFENGVIVQYRTCTAAYLVTESTSEGCDENSSKQ